MAKAPEDAILAHLGNAPAEGFKEYMAHTDDLLALDELSERQRSRVRILRAFQVAVIEVGNDERARGAPAHELIVDIVDSLGTAAAGIMAQGVQKRGWRGAAKRLTDVFGDAMKRYMKLVEKVDG